MSLREALATRIVEAGERLRVRSALNPILWLCAIVTPGAIFAASGKTETQTWLIWLAFLPVVIACAGFVFLLFVDRDKLQSEDYQIRKKSLDLIQQKGESVRIAPTSIHAIANPALPTLESAAEDEKP